MFLFMIIVLLFLIAGMFFGYLFRKRDKIIKTSDKMLTWSIYLLLFLLGVAVGSNQEIINNFDEIGVKAIILSVAGIIGSISIAYFVFRFFFLHRDEK